jgi:hypothetical protein
LTYQSALLQMASWEEDSGLESRAAAELTGISS